MMLSPDKKMQLMRRPLILFTCAMLGACASSADSTNEILDRRTGVTITSNVTPMILYRENPSLASHARNYLHLGPIEVNNTGSYQYFLWVGIWNTMETSDSSRQRHGFDGITIFADGEPLVLELAGWTPDAIGASAPVYLKPVSSAADAYYSVTVDQIRLIAEAKDIRLRTSGTSPREYSPWDAQRSARQSYQAFLETAFF
jgi:hypothetical protein